MGGDPNQMLGEDGEPEEGSGDSGGMPTIEEMMQEAMGGGDDWDDEEDEEDEQDLDEDGEAIDEEEADPDALD